MKILVVDDEELLVKGIRFNLQNEGYDVITASNGTVFIPMNENTESLNAASAATVLLWEQYRSVSLK